MYLPNKMRVPMMRIGLAASVALVLVLAGAFPANAQATRTWVSGVGDDVNPCSRTAPCKTFAGAISKTAAGGEINVLDPGGFGGVTITKSITIDGQPFLAGVLVSGTSAINVNAAPGDVVTLRNLTIDGLNTGLSGIKFIGGAALNIENCTIFGFDTAAIDITAPGLVFVRDTIIRNSHVGVHVHPAASPTAFAVVVLDNLRAVVNDTGVESQNANSIVVLNNSTLTGNGTGLLSVSGGAIGSYGNNRNVGNTANGAPTFMIAPQ